MGLGIPAAGTAVTGVPTDEGMMMTRFVVLGQRPLLLVLIIWMLQLLLLGWLLLVVTLVLVLVLVANSRGM